MSENIEANITKIIPNNSTSTEISNVFQNILLFFGIISLIIIIIGLIFLIYYCIQRNQRMSDSPQPINIESSFSIDNKNQNKNPNNLTPNQNYDFNPLQNASVISGIDSNNNRINMNLSEIKERNLKDEINNIIHGANEAANNSGELNGKRKKKSKKNKGNNSNRSNNSTYSNNEEDTNSKESEHNNTEEDNNNNNNNNNNKSENNENNIDDEKQSENKEYEKINTKKLEKQLKKQIKKFVRDEEQKV